LIFDSTELGRIVKTVLAMTSVDLERIWFWMKRLSHQVELSHLQHSVEIGEQMPFAVQRQLQSQNATRTRGPEGEEANQLLAITGKIVKSQTLTIPFFRSLTSLNLIVSTLFT
jgi:hypothetical protein